MWGLPKPISLAYFTKILTVAGLVVLLVIFAAGSGWLAASITDEEPPLEIDIIYTLQGICLAGIFILAGYLVFLYLRLISSPQRSSLATAKDSSSPSSEPPGSKIHHLPAQIKHLKTNLFRPQPADLHQYQVTTTPGSQPSDKPSLKLIQAIINNLPASDLNPTAKSDHEPRELLQDVLAGLLEEPDSSEPFVRLLKEIESLMGASSSVMFVTTESDDQIQPWAWTSSSDCNQLTYLLKYPPSRMGINDYESVQIISYPGQTHFRLIAVWLGDKAHRTGLLLLKAPASLKKSTLELSLLAVLGQGIANIIHSARRAQVNRRMALCEERAAIARDLHDSLAQSLSYLKIQVSRLQSLLQADRSHSQLDCLAVDTVIQELRTNLNMAYRQLRELITTCRLTMNGRNLGQALEDSVEEFGKRSSIVFDLDNRLTSTNLQVDEEMQILHIIREALSNIVRHSHAKHAKIMLHETTDGTVSINVTDDGIGINTSQQPDQHYGLLIMQERAHSLGGNIRLEKEPNGGTYMQVTFLPKSFSVSTTSAL